MTLSRLLIGLLAILYGAINLGAEIGIKYFYWGLVLFGIVYIVELARPILLGRYKKAE